MIVYSGNVPDDRQASSRQGKDRFVQKTILRTNKLCKSFSNNGVQQHVLKNLDMELREGDFTVIMGSSGSGKSTLLYALSGMDQPTLGEVYFEEVPLSRMSSDKLAVFRRSRCGFVFQQVHLLDYMSVLDNVLASGLLVYKNKREAAARARQLLTEVGLPESAWSKFPSQLSGGEAQRAGMARALMNNPRIVFADEPTGALNSASSQSVLEVLTKLNGNGQTLVAVTHDPDTALRGNRVLYLRDGTICGDLALGSFTGERNQERRKLLKGFLAKMGW